MNHPFLEVSAEAHTTSFSRDIISRFDDLLAGEAQRENLAGFLGVFRPSWRLYGLGLWQNHRDKVYHARLGELWKCTLTEPHPSSEFWAMVGSKKYHTFIMNDKENSLLCKLPDVVTLYRAALEPLKNGASWVLDKDVARLFLGEGNHRSLFKAEFLKDDIICLLETDHIEVICTSEAVNRVAISRC